MKQTTPTIRIRVVQPPTTGELLDQYYRRRGMIHGSRRAPSVTTEDPRKAFANTRTTRLGKS